MAKDHGARQQKRAAKQKAKRQAKRSTRSRRDSKDPSIRLRSAEKWPIVEALAGTQLWDEGIGYLSIARRSPDGEFLFAVFLTDVYCLGVKNALWDSGTRQDYEVVIRRLSQTREMRAIAPECLAKIVRGAVDYAQSFGFPPHPDYRHAAMLLEGIDPSSFPESFTFGRDGKPLYIQGPNESPSQAVAIMKRMQDVGGDYLLVTRVDDRGEPADLLGTFDQVEFLDEGESES